MADAEQSERPGPSATAALSAPPRTVRRRLAQLEWAEPSVRRRGFWVGWGGRLLTLTIAILLVALLVGWILLWVERPDPDVALLTLGCVAFTAVLVVLATLHSRLLANWRLREAETAFLAGVSHNLRTPIGGIRAAAQALQQPGLDASQHQRLIAAIIQETRRLGLRVDNVLETGRLDVERLSFNPQPLDLAALVTTKADEARGVVEARGGTLELQPEPVRVLGDERAIRLLVDNLLDNAVKYSDGPPRIRIEVCRRGDFAFMRVTDEGIGFDPKELPHLFRRFGRGDTGRPGTGLGLPLARAIARGHGGSVHLHSQGKGCGAAGEVWLPAVEEK